MARKNTRKNRNRKNRKTMRGGDQPTGNAAAQPMNNAPVTTPANQPAATPANQSTGTNNTSGNSTMTGGRRRGHRKSHKLSSGAAKWRDHMMKVYREMKSRNPATKLGDAMRAAKKSYNA